MVRFNTVSVLENAAQIGPFLVFTVFYSLELGLHALLYYI